MNERLEFALRELIAQERRKVRSYSELAKKIWNYCQTSLPRADREHLHPLDRRKLQDLAETDIDVSLRVSELRTLDAFLTPLGESLAMRPIFRSQAFLQEMSQRAPVILVGTRSDEKAGRIDISHWDMQALIDLSNALRRCTPSAEIEIVEAIFRGDLPGAAREQTWREKTTDANTIISIGSARVNHASEYVLANLFQVRSLERRRDLETLPIAFVWPADAITGESTFHITPEELVEIARRRRINYYDPGGDTPVDPDDLARKLALETPPPPLYALLVKNTLYVQGVRAGGRAFAASTSGYGPQRSANCDYGLIALQRRPPSDSRSPGALWSVISGVSGPGTYGAALMMDSLAGALPIGPGGGASQTLVAVVESEVERDGPDADPRRVLPEPKIVLGPAALEGI